MTNTELTNINLSKWVVGIKGGPNNSAFEISVLRDNYDLGKRSYGWFGSNKLLISVSGCGTAEHLIKLVWDKQIKLAHEVANELNALEDIIDVTGTDQVLVTSTQKLLS